MQRYFDLVGDHMPNTEKIHLPSWESQKNVNERYKDDVMTQLGDETPEFVSLRTFYRLWGEDFQHIVIPEVSSM